MTTTFADDLNTAIAHHQRGGLEQASRIYQRILGSDPDHPDALHLLGVVSHQRGEHARAVDLIGRAIARRSSVAAFHGNLAEAYRAQGELVRAIGCCKTALRLMANFPQAAMNLGLALRDQGKTDAAVAQLEATLRMKPDFAEAHNNLGDLYRVLGDRTQAVAHCRQAVQYNPHLAAAHSNLGQLLLEQRELDEALQHCREAVRLRPDFPEAHNNLGNVLREQGKLVEAKACYAEALRLNPDLAMAHGNMGQALQQEGNVQEALVWYEQALQLDPNSARVHCYMASAFEARENYEEALVRYEIALRLDPNFAAAHNGLGWVRHEQGALQEAVEHFRSALRVQPDFPNAQCNLGMVLEELGDFDGAERAWREVLKSVPRHGAAMAQLATMKRGKLSEAERAALRERLNDPALDDFNRANLLFGLAQVLDADGDFAQAASSLQQANALALGFRNKLGQRYDHAEHVRFVDRLLAIQTPEFFERVRGFGLDTERPVFIVGLPRSGTTLTEQILASHSQVFGAGELKLARMDFLDLGDQQNEAQALDSLSRLTREKVQRIGRRHLDDLHALNSNAVRVVDKMPDNYIYVGLLATLFPRARFIHCRRDLRDVAVSCWMTNFRQIRWANDVDQIAGRFADYQRLMEHWRQVLPVPVLEVDYEETVADLESMARRLIDWCGLEWEPACLAFHECKRAVRTASVSQVRQPLYSRSVARWKQYEPALTPLFERLDSFSRGACTARCEHRG
jgi:tetratricopeptide (TPR) repeat protein